MPPCSYLLVGSKVGKPSVSLLQLGFCPGLVLSSPWRALLVLQASKIWRYTVSAVAKVSLKPQPLLLAGGLLIREEPVDSHE